MLKSIVFKDTHIYYKHIGRGKPVVLLHGFMESLDVWNEIVEELAKEYQVVAIDLPGHGKSGNLGQVHTMKLMAQVVLKVIDSLNLEKVVLIGHSMGGYVVLEFLKNFSHRLAGLVLMHSTPFADSKERKVQRDQMILEIKKGKKIKIAKEHVQKTFAQYNLNKFVRQVGFLKIIAINTNNDGIIAALEGMKERDDYVEVLRDTSMPFLYILGAKDNFISLDIKDKISLPKNSEVVILSESGHQGYIEEKEKVLINIKEFLKKYFK